MSEQESAPDTSSMKPTDALVLTASSFPSRQVAAELRAEMGFPVEPPEGPVAAAEILIELRMDATADGSPVIALTDQSSAATPSQTI